ncbi:hypothetical protein [Maridesulfovibrio salexigens]|uniref:Uncharacterized protein n=1 Tax=Maridesulfovibrio salexigens (strain ATCC 14822 / DSM 2638 / NCIMB 8403 / VKM B-1763) TaxID=526222 RepID=C6BWX0_MARSD|nr:hypothetical protein [Maridesulfovibrio salexigens]ACS78450.1 hypothetical protein Desal_0383 [Maridesulfovibrio salexigens DSM 2638]
MATEQGFFGLLERYYASKAANRSNTCNVGAWAINRDQALVDPTEREVFLITLFNRFLSGNTKKEVVQKDNNELVNGLSECTCSGGKILVVSKGAAFSGKVVSYAVEMAARTKSSLIALNLDERGSNFTDFCSQSEKNISHFSTKAKEAGLCFAHVVKQGAEDSVVAELHNQDEELRYVMEDVIRTQNAGTTIPVYTRATLRVG